MYNFQPKTLFIGKLANYLPSCHSTNNIAMQMIQSGNVFDGTIVVTDNQFEGRGQRGNSWEAMPGQNITLSVILKPTFLSPIHQFGLNMSVSLAIQDFLKTLDVEDTSIKWPNDVYVGNKKMGGVLIENVLVGSTIGHSIVGIGLNINQLTFENSHATSLRIATNRNEYPLEKLIENLCENLEKRYLALKETGWKKMQEDYTNQLFRYNEWHRFQEKETVFEGRILGVSDHGQLWLETRHGIRLFDFKEISFLNLG